MKLRAYACGADFGRIESWITDERTHAFWCAWRFSWPLTREDFEDRLRELTAVSGLKPFVAETEEGVPVGFLCISPGPAEGETTLKFVVIDPTRRGKGFGREMVSLASEAAGAGTVRLSVFTPNVSAIRCYESAGFVTERVEEGSFAFHEERWGRCHMALRDSL